MKRAAAPVPGPGRYTVDAAAKALELLKSMDGEDERERAAVYMDGLSQMRSDWSRKRKPPKPRFKRF